MVSQSRRWTTYGSQSNIVGSAKKLVPLVILSIELRLFSRTLCGKIKICFCGTHVILLYICNCFVPVFIGKTAKPPRKKVFSKVNLDFENLDLQKSIQTCTGISRTRLSSYNSTHGVLKSGVLARSYYKVSEPRATSVAGQDIEKLFDCRGYRHDPKITKGPGNNGAGVAMPEKRIFLNVLAQETPC